MYCQSCGTQNPDSSVFCGKCGVAVSASHGDSIQRLAFEGPQLASVGRRLAALTLDYLIIILTLGIGFIIWSLVVYGRGQTPGKQLVGIYAAGVTDPRIPLPWGYMFLREFVIKGLLFNLLLSLVSSGIVWALDYLWALWDGSGRSQTLHDKIVGSSVYKV